MKVVTAAQMRGVDRTAIEGRGISASVLMERAGTAVAQDIAEAAEPGHVVVFCGKGNNGGDGFVVARLLAEAGWKVSVGHVAKPGPKSGAARKAWEKLPKSVKRFDAAGAAARSKALGAGDYVVDALLGTGASGVPKPPYDAIIKDINAEQLPVFSIDIPSGLDPDTGAAGIAVRAARTITIGLPKLGMISGAGPAHCGTVVVRDIGFPADLLARESFNLETMLLDEARALLPPRPADGHKGTFGTVLLCAGSAAMPGAAALAGLGAVRSGCGLVRVHAPEQVRQAVSFHLPEAVLSSAEGDARILAPLPQSDWNGLLAGAEALVLGPGIGTGNKTASFLRQALAVKLPAVVDADALNLVAADRSLTGLLSAHHVLTPHPGEMARLLECSTAEIQADRVGTARRAAETFGTIIVLKGAGTLVARPDGLVSHNPTGSTAWARGGAGDVLAGLIGGLLAQGCDPWDAARLGTFVHGVAADLFVEKRSARGATIRDVVALLPEAFRHLETCGRPGI